MIRRKMTRASVLVLAGLVAAFSVPARAQDAEGQITASLEQRRVAVMLQMLIQKVDRLMVQTEQLQRQIQAQADRNMLLEQRNAAMEQQNAAMLKTQQSLQEANDNAVAALKGEVEMRRRTGELVRKLESQLESARARNRQLEEALSERQARIQRLEVQLRHRIEQIQQQRLEDPPGPAGRQDRPEGDDGGKADVTKKITGQVTAVRDDLASVNVGSSSGVKKGMRLIVYRGEAFVGYLDVEVVESRKAAGYLRTTKLIPQAGDKVTNRLPK
jgi:chromosome segregation ATPase